MGVAVDLDMRNHFGYIPYMIETLTRDYCDKSTRDISRLDVPFTLVSDPLHRTP